MRQPPPGRVSARRQSSAMLSARGGKHSARSASGGLSGRMPFLRTGVDMPWVDEIAKQYGLEYEARQRAAGVAREMAAAGYTAAQARHVVLGLLHGTREKLQAAWRVFVTGNDPDEAVLSRAEWRIVLSMLTGGLGMSSAETDHLFQVFDKDGSGTLDYGEFCEVLEALPLQRPFEESPLGSAVGALQSLFVLNSSLVSRLSLGQLASAGRTISRLRYHKWGVHRTPCLPSRGARRLSPHLPAHCACAAPLVSRTRTPPAWSPPYSSLAPGAPSPRLGTCCARPPTVAFPLRRRNPRPSRSRVVRGSKVAGAVA